MGQSAEDKLLSELGRIYEQHGYARYKVSTFEEYDFYVRYKSFLRSEPIVSFTGPDGRLMALKPDVTLSIAKNAPAEPTFALKAHYRESVYRQGRGAGELKEITQAGLELIGVIDRYAMCEVMRMALKSLEAMGGRTELAVSHLGLVEALLADAGLAGESANRALEMIGRRSIHELEALLPEGDARTRIIALINAYGPLETLFPVLETLNINAATDLALSELIRLRDDLAAFGMGDALRLDFSIINDMDYYGGTIFKGYLDGVARCVLSGGRYDRLIEKLGKKGGAVGFAVYPDALEARLESGEGYDADTLILYDDKSEVADIAQAVEMLGKGGQRVVVQRVAPPGGRYRATVRMSGRGVEMEC